MSTPIPDDYRPPIKAQFKAEVSILRFNGSSDGYRVEIKDRDSGARMLVILSLEEFARCLGGLVSDAAGQAIRLPLFGTTEERKSELVPHSASSYLPSDAPRTPEEDESLRPFEVDGWRGHTTDMRNQHRGDGKGSCRVGFSRDVLIEGGGEEA